VRLRIERQRACALLRRDIVHNVKMFRIILVDDRERPCRPVRAEHQSARRIEHGAVRALPDRHAGDAVAVAAVRDDHLFVLADRKQAMVRVVERQTGRLLAGFQRPGGNHLESAFVDHCEFGLVFDVHVHPATPVADLEKRLVATEKLLKDLSAKSTRSARLTILLGGLLLALMAFYFIYGYQQISTLLEPDTLVSLGEQWIEEQLPEARKAAEAEVRKSAPVWAASLSKQAVDISLHVSEKGPRLCAVKTLSLCADFLAASMNDQIVQGLKLGVLFGSHGA